MRSIISPRAALALPLTSILLAVFCNASLTAQSVFINELHYDDDMGRTTTGLEVAGVAGTDLAATNELHSIVLYHSDGMVDHTFPLSGVIPNQQRGYGVLDFPHNLDPGNQGVALVKEDPGVDGTLATIVLEFLSYGGAFTANAGPAAGLTSEDIGVSESSTTPESHSLQLVGSLVVVDGLPSLTWAGPMANTFGSVNTGQSLPVEMLSFTVELVAATPAPAASVLSSFTID